MAPVFNRLQFDLHGAEADEDYSLLQAEGQHEGAERNIVQRDFLLNNELYSAFNT